MQRMEENNEVSAIVDMIVPGKRPRGRWMDGARSDMQAAYLPGGCPGEHPENQDFGPLTSPGVNRRRRR